MKGPRFGGALLVAAPIANPELTFDSRLCESLGSLTQLSRLGKVVHASPSALPRGPRRARHIRIGPRGAGGRRPFGRRLLDPDDGVPEARGRVRQRHLLLELLRRVGGAE